jgi:hypothetical protein
LCLDPKEVVFKKPKESSQHLKLLYIWGHIDGRLISMMLIDGGVAVKLISYAVFKKHGWEDDELMKTNLMLNNMGGQPDGSKRHHLHGAYCGKQVTRYRVLRHRGAR